MSDDEKINNDYDYSRDTLYELIEKGKDALENMIEVARESEHPRAYEVLSGLIKNVADVNDKLQDLNKKQKQLNDDEKPQQVENQQNNYYLGSTSDIQKMLRENDVVDVEAERVISREPQRQERRCPSTVDSRLITRIQKVYGQSCILC